MKKKFYSFVSMFLVICMVMSSIPVYAITEPESKLDTPETNAENKETITNPEFNAAGSSKVLDYVDKAEFESHKFIGRVTEEEELNSYVFQNEDGSRTAYFFSENVKYVDKDGIVQEKDISLVATRDGYKTTKNEVSVNFGSSPSNGISMGYGGHTVTLKPIFTTKGVTASKKDNAVEYVELFDSNTTLKYTPLLSGIKEDIVLTKYTGENEYSFTLTTNGLGIYESANGYFLAESKAAKAIFYLGDIIAYDANNVPYEGTLSVKTVKENQEYTLIVSVDEEFLTDKNTVYPVTIDPTITISDTASGAGAIQDAPIFSARPSSNHGTYEYDRVGTPSADFGVGRTVVRLYGLINSSVYKNLSANQITSVIFYAKEATGSATQYINLYPLTNTSWTESGVTWNNVGSRVTSVNYGANMAYAQLTPFTITNLVKGWKNGTYAANAGFIMMSSNESANKCFVSSEHSDTSRRPYVAMSYTAAISLNKSSVSIGEGSTTTLTATTNPSGTAVTWSSTTPSVATVSSSGVVTAIKAGKATIKATMTTGGTTYTANCTVYVTIEDGVYYIQNQNSNKYLTTDGTVTGSPNVIQLSKYTEAGNSDAVRIRQMWKIKYLRDGQYSIRPMNKLDMGLDVTGINVDTFTIGTQDQLDAIISTARWGISRVGTGFQITKQGIPGYSLQVQGDSTANNAEIIADDYMDVDSLYWNLVEVANPPSGVYWYDTGKGAIATNITRAINVGESKSLTNLQLIPVAYSGTNISQSFTWSTSNTSVATVNSSGTVTGVSSGTVVVTATYQYSSTQQCNSSFTVVVKERYLTELVETYSFSEYEATLIRSLYDKIDTIYSNESNLQRAWRCSRLLGGIVYKGDFFANTVQRIAWNQVAGVVYEPFSEEDYFVYVLGFSENQYNILKLAIEDQHSRSSSNYDIPDFAHYQISLAARLAYATNNDLPIADIASIFVGEDISYLAGWFGDAVLADNNGTTSFKNGDYCADLDAENTYRIILEGYSSVEAISRYFCSFSNSTNRATIFLSYLPYDVVCDKVFFVLVDIELITIMNSFYEAGYYESAEYYRNLLDDEEYHFEKIQEEYPDTYNFLMSLEDNLANIGEY